MSTLDSKIKAWPWLQHCSTTINIVLQTCASIDGDIVDGTGGL